MDRNGYQPAAAVTALGGAAGREPAGRGRDAAFARRRDRQETMAQPILLRQQFSDYPDIDIFHKRPFVEFSR